MRNKSRKFWLNLHLVVGLAAGLPLLAVGVTGALLGFAPEIHRWEQPEIYTAVPRGDPLGLPALVRRLRAEHPDVQLNHVTVAAEPDHTWEAWVASRSEGGPWYPIHLNPYTGRVARDTTDGGWPGRIERVHRHLGAGPQGKQVVGASSLLLIVLSVSGLYLWWPMRRGTVRRVTRTRDALGWHNLVGLVVFPLLIVMALTGVQLTWGKVMNPLVRTVTRSPEMPPPPSSTPAAGREALTLADAIERVQRRYPGARITGFGEAGGMETAYKVVLGYPGEMNRFGWERVWVDRYSGEVLRHDDTYSYSLASRYQNSWWQLHTGEIFGLAGRVTWALASASLGALFLTGGWQWWKKRRGARARQKSRSSPSGVGPTAGTHAVAPAELALPRQNRSTGLEE